MGEGAVGHVHAGLGEDVFGEGGEMGYVHGESSTGHGFVVWLVVGFVFRDALEEFAGSGHL